MPLYAPPPEGQNLLINGGFQWFERVDPTAATALSDDAYDAPDCWYSLIQGANATITRSAGSDGTQYAAKLVTGGTTNRFGLAQVVEAEASIPMQGRAVRLQLRVRATKNAGSGSIDVRCAILEWTGTADAPTTDVVNDWTSSTYTTGNFFISTTTTLVGTAQISASHNTWTDLAVVGTVSSSCKNLIVFIWTEDAPAHASDFLELSECGLYDGTSPRPWLPRQPNEELAMCQRRCWVVTSDATVTSWPLGMGHATNATTTARIVVVPPVPMRDVPSLTVTADEWILSDGSTGFDCSVVSLITAGTSARIFTVRADSTGLTAFRPYRLTTDVTQGRRAIFSADL